MTLYIIIAGLVYNKVLCYFHIMLHDFHTHTFNSDGELSPIELIRRACVNGYATIGITDHAGLGSLERIIREIRDDCVLARKHWGILAIPGIELTHLPPESISDIARRAKESGASLVIVHGQSQVEPVPEGTNLAAVQSPYVDILAHPGLITTEEAKLAAKNGIFIEISGRRGHSKTNGHVATVCHQLGVRLLVNSDAHSEKDLLTLTSARDILKQAGLKSSHYHQILEENPLLLIEKVKKSGWASQEC